MRVYVAKKMNENITSDLVTLKVGGPDGEVKVEVYNILPTTNKRKQHGFP